MTGMSTFPERVNTPERVMTEIWKLLLSIPWYGWIPIVAILCGSIIAVVRMIIRHRERMAMIRQGIDPGPDE